MVKIIVLSVMLTYLSSFSKFRAELKKLKKLQQFFLGLNIEKLFSQLRSKTIFHNVFILMCADI